MVQVIVLLGDSELLALTPTASPLQLSIRFLWAGAILQSMCPIGEKTVLTGTRLTGVLLGWPPLVVIQFPLSVMASLTSSLVFLLRR